MKKPNRPSPKTQQFLVRLDEKNGYLVNQYAIDNDMSKAAVIRKSVREFFERLAKIDIGD